MVVVFAVPPGGRLVVVGGDLGPGGVDRNEASLAVTFRPLVQPGSCGGKRGVLRRRIGIDQLDLRACRVGGQGGRVRVGQGAGCHRLRDPGQRSAATEVDVVVAERSAGALLGALELREALEHDSVDIRRREGDVDPDEERREAGRAVDRTDRRRRRDALRRPARILAAGQVRAEDAQLGTRKRNRVRIQQPPTVGARTHQSRAVGKRDGRVDAGISRGDLLVVPPFGERRPGWPPAQDWRQDDGEPESHPPSASCGSHRRCRSPRPPAAYTYPHRNHPSEPAQKRGTHAHGNLQIYAVARKYFPADTRLDLTTTIEGPPRPRPRSPHGPETRPRGDAPGQSGRRGSHDPRRPQSAPSAS